MLFSNVNGVGLDDKRFWPLYEAANDLGAVFYIHPTHPVGVEAMTDYWLMPLVGFCAIPRWPPQRSYLAAWRSGFRGYAGRCATWAARFRIWPNGWIAATKHSANAARIFLKPPTEYLKTFYYDTVNFNPRAVQLAIDFAGADHILAGSDYPHQIGSIPKMLETVRWTRRRRDFGGKRRGC